MTDSKVDAFQASETLWSYIRQDGDEDAQTVSSTMVNDEIIDNHL